MVEADSVNVIEKASECLPHISNSKVVVIWYWSEWEKRGLHESGPEADRLRKQYAAKFNKLRNPGDSVFFVLLYFNKTGYKHKNINLCRGTVKTKKQCPTDTVKKKVCVWNRLPDPETYCQLPQMTVHKHLACELDDVLLTKFHCELTKNRCAIKVVSADQGVLKSPDDVATLEGWVENANDAGFDPSLTLVEV